MLIENKIPKQLIFFISIYYFPYCFIRYRFNFHNLLFMNGKVKN